MNNSPMDADLAEVLIIGASVRSAAMSAARAGWRVWAVDLFGDEDLKESALQYRQIRNYRQLPAAISDWPDTPWLATGALENHPRLIDRLSKHRPHWGSPAEVVRKVRDPRSLYRSLVEAGQPALKIWTDKSPPIADGRWMLKPRRSAGGQGIFVWDEEATQSPAALATLRKPHFFQQRAEGEARSAVFLSEWNRISLIGTAKLLLANAPGPRFGYGGAIGPLALSPERESRIEESGQAIAGAFALRGLWGMDFIDEGVRTRPLEVNPRYTATVELYEQALDAAILPFHRRACENWRTSAEARPPLEIMPWNAKPQRCVGKVVIYADREIIIPDWREWPTARDAMLPGLPVLADRPRPGNMVTSGYPVCSLLASGVSETDCRRALNEKLKAFQTHFAEAGVPVSVPAISLV